MNLFTRVKLNMHSHGIITNMMKIKTDGRVYLYFTEIKYSTCKPRLSKAQKLNYRAINNMNLNKLKVTHTLVSNTISI